MAMKELCPICVEMDAITFLNKVVTFGIEFTTVKEVVDTLKLFGANESDEHLIAVASKYLEEYQ